MALPTELRQLLLKELPAHVWESNPALLRFWLQFTQPELLTARRYFASPFLNSETELYEKILAWHGHAFYGAQQYLPYGLALCSAINAENVPVFLDAAFRTSNSSLIATRLFLRKYSKQPESTALQLMLVALATRFDFCLEVSDFIDDLLTGEIILSVRLVNFLLTTSDREPYFYCFCIGAAIAYQLPFVRKARRFALIDCAYGYALAGGRDWAAFAAALKAPIDINLAAATAARLNLPTSVLFDEYEATALNYLAVESLRTLSQDGNRAFPALIEIIPVSPRLLTARARALLPLLPKIYAASTSRNRYLQQLSFCAHPETYEGDPRQISHELRFIYVRLAYANIEEVRYTLRGGNALKHVADPLRLAQYIAQLPAGLFATSDYAEKLLNCAALHDVFAAVAKIVAPALTAELILLNQDVKTGAGVYSEAFNVVRVITTVEELRAILPTHGEQRTYKWQNSYLLQKLAIEPVVRERAKGGLIEMTFRHANMVFTTFINDYEAELWQKLGLALPTSNQSAEAIHLKFKLTKLLEQFA